MKKAGLLFSFLLFFLFSSLLQAAGEEPAVTIKLSVDTPFTLEFDSPAEIFRRDGAGWVLAAEERLNPGKVWTVRREEKTVSLSTAAGDRITFNIPLLLAPLPPRQVFKVNGREYPGKIEIRPGPVVTVVNHTGLEAYVAGVLAGELYPDWPPAVLRAQAVAARSYALYNLKRHEEADFCDLEHCQKYRGLTRNPSFSSAVEDTRGEVLVWEGEIINAVYHASSGGFTQNNEDVWEGESLPYLRRVEDFDQEGEKYFWPESYFFRGEELAGRLGLKGDGALEVSPYFSPSGSLTAVCFARVNGGERETFRAETLRRLLDLPSPQFRLFRVAEKTMAAAVAGPEELLLGKGEERDGLLFLEARMVLAFPAEEITEPVLIGPGEGILMIGRGSGHGVGLSQWGARALAGQGYDYRAILNHYYGDGVVLRREY